MAAKIVARSGGVPFNLVGRTIDVPDGNARLSAGTAFPVQMVLVIFKCVVFHQISGTDYRVYVTAGSAELFTAGSRENKETSLLADVATS